MRDANTLERLAIATGKVGWKNSNGIRLNTGKDSTKQILIQELFIQ